MSISQRYQKHQRELLELAVIALFGLAARLAVFSSVAVNGDSGLYIYDAKQLLWGHWMFVEYPSRSPLFEYLLAAAIWLGDSAITSVRAFMLLVGMLLGLAVYVFARQIHGHVTGLVAAAIFYLTPFSVVWGLWVKTEQAAGLLLVSAFIIALYRIDVDEIPFVWAAGIGVLFGAAFLVRRVAIVHIGAFALFVGWYRYRQHGDVHGTIRSASIVVGSAAGTLTVAYLLLARGNAGVAMDIAYHHGAALILSSGQGSLGWVGLESASAVTAASQDTLFHRFCQKCGANTIEVFIRTTLVVFPAFILSLPFLRSYTRQAGDFFSETALPTSYGALSLLVIPLVALNGMWVRALAAVTLFAAIIVVWRVDAIDWNDLWSPKLALPITVLLALTAGYLYRDRILYVTYFQDFYPYFAVVVAVTAVEFSRALKRTEGRRVLAVAAVVVVLLSTGVAAANAYPYQPGGTEEQENWHSFQDVQDYGADVDDRVEPGERVFVGQPLFVADSDRRIAADLSRKYYVYRGWPNSEKRADTDRELVKALESGDVAIAVVDKEAEAVLESPPVREAFRENYCRVDTPGLYSELDAALYEYQPDAVECETYE